MKLFGLEISRSAKSIAVKRSSKAPRIVTRSILDAAKHGLNEKSWTTTPATADTIIRQNWKTAVARSMDQAENAPHGRRFLALLRDNVPGPTGFNLQADVRNPSNSKDKAANKAIEAAWKDFSENHFEITGQMNRTGMERLGIASCGTHGEFFINSIIDPSLPHGITFQIIDPLMIDSTLFANLGKGRVIRCGIEMDQYRRPLAIYVNEFDTYGMSHVEHHKLRQRIPMESLTHVMMPEMINQSRGLPWMRTSLWQMRMLKGYGDAAVTNARIGASKMGFFRDPESESDDDEIIDAAEPGAFEDIGNRELQNWDPMYPNGEYESFTRSCLHGLASGLLVSYHSLSGDLTSVNFSSIRQGELDQREVWKGLQNWYIKAMARPLFEKWLEIAMLKNVIKINDTPLKIERMDRYKNVNFVGRRWEWVDPLKDIKAKKEEIELGVNTRARVIRERTSEDPEDIFDEVEEEEKRFPKSKPAS